MKQRPPFEAGLAQAEMQEKSAQVMESEVVEQFRQAIAQAEALGGEMMRQQRAVLIEQAKQAQQVILGSQEQREPTKEQLKERANCQKDWTLITQERLKHPLSYIKFVASKLRHLESLRPGEAKTTFDKPKAFQAFALKQIREYDQQLEHVFSATDIIPSSESAFGPASLGFGKYGQRPTIFSDAQLTPRQRNIIESHEAGHGIRDLISSEGRELLNEMDRSVLEGTKDRNYLQDPNEVIERVAQVKNYFGMNAAEQLTPAHWKYARDHYVSDTGLDNTMSLFFKTIPDEKLPGFLAVANELPI